MLPFPQISPYIFELGPLKPTWYGMMYVVGFGLGYWAARYRARHDPHWPQALISDLLTYLMIGVIVGGRVGYVLFYGMGNWAKDWLYPLKIWEGGMSFHGGLLGVLIAMFFFARKHGKRYFEVTDFIAPLIPIGLFFGRIGNFINGELWGRATDLPWGMVFPTGGSVARHPSQLYEALLEGLVLFVILWAYSGKPRAIGRTSGLFLIGYGVFRTAVEFVREPDSHLRYLAFDWLTMGMVLSLPMIVFGLYLYLRPLPRAEEHPA
ncbi:MAG: prolipoprotein diacylglyceryl transferase [Cardiobacteriaceae bacterium]|nr:prolipoprotein diacylglyceryl transferase [Cardiobacteriaceae bacterium]